jgi:RNA ligase
MNKYQPDFEELDKLVESGHLSKKEEGDLLLYNYSDKTTFEKYWNDHTINSRGTIYSKSTGKVISPAFKKFFNFSELSPEKQKEIMSKKNFTTMEKLDGSMGNVFFHDDKWRVTTRGSFSSEQAIYATEKLLPKYKEALHLTPRSMTFLVEIIYPENKIVVDYRDEKSLTTLAGFFVNPKEEFEEMSYNTLDFYSPFPVVKIHGSNSIEELIETVSNLTAQEEGFVVKLENGDRVKFKSPEYLKIARIISRMSPLVLWESMVDGKVSQELLQSIPEEFRTDYEGYTTSLEGAYSSVYRNVAIRYNQVMKTLGYTQKDELPDNIDSLRKPFALALQNDPNELNSAMWGVLLQKPAQLNKFIMDRIKPVGNVLNENL